MTVTSAAFWDRTAAKYSQQAIADPDSYSRKLNATQALMNQDMQVLEFGCGTGSTALAHAPHVARIIATDVSPEMIRIGRERAQAADVHNVEFQVSGIEDFAAPDGSFDMILALNLLHLVPDRGTALRKVHQLLKPGGIFVSSTVCLSDRMWYLRPVIPIMQWLGKAPYVSFVSERQMLEETRAAGFQAGDHWTHGRSNSLFLVASRPD